MSVLTVDPGIGGLGAALWEESTGCLRAASFITPALDGRARATNDPVGWKLLSVLLSSWCAKLGAHVDLLVVEFPKIVPSAHLDHDVDPEDILRLGGLAATIAALVPAGEARLVRPFEWKRQVPKKISVARSEAALSIDERSRVSLPSARSLAHNVWDGVGIGLWLHRKERRASGLDAGGDLVA